MPTAPSAQIAKAAIITPQTRAIRKTDWSTNRTISSIAQPKTAKMAAAAMKSAPVQRTSSVNNIAMAGSRSKTPRIAQRAGRHGPRSAARELADTVTDTLHRRYFHMRLECLQVGSPVVAKGNSFVTRQKPSSVSNIAKTATFETFETQHYYDSLLRLCLISGAQRILPVG
jgi:hypothetical protein